MPSLVYYTDTIFLDSGRSIGKIFLPHALFLKGHNMSILGTLGQFLVLYPLFDCFTVNFGPLLRGKPHSCDAIRRVLFMFDQGVTVYWGSNVGAGGIM